MSPRIPGANAWSLFLPPTSQSLSGPLAEEAPSAPATVDAAASLMPTTVDGRRLEGWLRSLRERQGGVVARFPSTSKRKTIRRALADSCSGVSRHLAARALGLFRPDATYRREAKHFRAQLRGVRPLYPSLSRRLSADAFAKKLSRSRWYAAHGQLLDHLGATQSMRDTKKIRLYNQRVLPSQLRRIGTSRGTSVRPEFHLVRSPDHVPRRQHLSRLRRLLATGAPVVIGVDAYYQGRPTKREPAPKKRWHRNCHYVVAIKIPGRRGVMIIDPWPGAAHGGVSFQRLDRLHMPGTYGSDRVRVGTRFGYFRDATSRKALTIMPPSMSSSAPSVAQE